jgi:hypothetical protein
MPQENVDAVRPVYRQWARGNFRAGKDLLDDEVVFVTFATEGDDLTYRGPAGVAEWMHEFLTQWTEFKVTAEEFIAAGEKVLAVGHQTARGRQSGVAVEMPVFGVWTFRQGKVIRLEFFRDRSRAFEAAGLPK